MYLLYDFYTIPTSVHQKTGKSLLFVFSTFIISYLTSFDKTHRSTKIKTSTKIAVGIVFTKTREGDKMTIIFLH